MQLSEKDATALIRKQDEDRAAWVLDCRVKKDPWDASLYDMVIPMDKSEVEKVADMGANHLKATCSTHGVIPKGVHRIFCWRPGGCGAHKRRAQCGKWRRKRGLSPLSSINMS
jgi:hypothetical protein